MFKYSHILSHTLENLAQLCSFGRMFFEIAGIYSPNAYRGFAREFIKDLERIRFKLTLSLLDKKLAFSRQRLYSL